MPRIFLFDFPFLFLLSLLNPSGLGSVCHTGPASSFFACGIKVVKFLFLFNFYFGQFPLGGRGEAGWARTIWFCFSLKISGLGRLGWVVGHECMDE